jgi:hypothetical protein
VPSDALLLLRRSRPPSGLLTGDPGVAGQLVEEPLPLLGTLRLCTANALTLSPAEEKKAFAGSLRR